MCSELRTIALRLPIEPSGNSGGPLLDSSGRLIGVSTAIFTPTGTSAGVGFAIPVDTVASVVPQLITSGRVMRPSLGIQVGSRGVDSHCNACNSTMAFVFAQLIPNHLAAPFTVQFMLLISISNLCWSATHEHGDIKTP